MYGAAHMLVFLQQILPSDSKGMKAMRQVAFFFVQVHHDVSAFYRVGRIASGSTGSGYQQAA